MFAVEIEKLEESAANAIQPFYVEYFMLASSSPKSAAISQVRIFVRPIGTKGSVDDALYRENRFAKRSRWTHLTPRSRAATNESYFRQLREIFREPHR